MLVCDYDDEIKIMFYAVLLMDVGIIEQYCIQLH